MKGEFDPIIDHVRTTAGKMLADGVTEALSASKKINEDNYTTKDLILTMAKLATIAVDGGATITQKVVGETPQGAIHVAGFSQTIAQRMAKEARLVYRAATSKIESGDYDVDDWIVTATRLVDIAVVGGMEITETVLIGPGQFESDALSFDLQVPVSDESRHFGAVSLKRFGPDDEAEIPLDQIAFEPASLAPDETEFRLLIKPKGLPSGVYRGTVQVGGDQLAVEITL